jgi:dihydropteroate synthase
MRDFAGLKDNHFARVVVSCGNDLGPEMQLIGVDRCGMKIMQAKGWFLAVKLLGVGSVAANVLKQEALSLGGEAALSHGCLNLSAKFTDLLVFGSRPMFDKLCKKLKLHQFGLPRLSIEILTAVDNFSRLPRPLKIGSKRFNFGRRTYLMGILNVTPDSFSDGGRFLSVEAAVAQAHAMQSAGADIIDIGGESTRPGAQKISAAEEVKRVVPVIRRLKKRLKIPISVDTYKAEVAAAALAAGAVMVNDISGLRFDKAMAGVVARARATVCVMHIQGKPKNMQKKPAYRDLISEIYSYLKESIEIGKRAGILVEQIIVDPGIGFGKTTENNFEILKRLAEFKSLGCPVLVGPSRKTFLGEGLGLLPGERLEGTVAAVAAAVAGGADLVRVHDVSQIKKAAYIADQIARRR